ncbi:MAG TPA: hypothetical protein VGF28_09815 [Thermoanaerobaculia bacterium]|jgi:hypothetical protein
MGGGERAGRSDHGEFGRQDQPDFGYELLVPAQPPISVTDARAIAVAFVQEEAMSGTCPEWTGADVGEATPFYSTSAPHPLAYEFPLIKDGVGVGAVLCGATEGAAAVISYSREGASIAAALRAHVEEAVGRQVESEPRYFYGGASHFGIEVQMADAVQLPIRNDDLTVIPEERTVLYSPTFAPSTRTEWERRFAAHYRISRQWIEAHRQVRNDFLRSQERNRVEANASKKPEVKSGKIALREFPHFFQTVEQWDNGTCASGCAPLAAALVFAYWDRNGFPKMIGSKRNNSHSSPEDDDVIEALAELRRLMGTWCGANSDGVTYIRDIEDGVEAYAGDRGYTRSRATGYYSKIWSRTRDEIDEDRPPILSFSFPGGDGHAVVPYSYKDSTKDSQDELCVLWGWEEVRTRCLMVDSPTEEWKNVVRIRPKK